MIEDPYNTLENNRKRVGRLVNTYGRHYKTGLTSGTQVLINKELTHVVDASIFSCLENIISN